MFNKDKFYKDILSIAVPITVQSFFSIICKCNRSDYGWAAWKRKYCRSWTWR